MKITRKDFVFTVPWEELESEKQWDFYEYIQRNQTRNLKAQAKRTGVTYKDLAYMDVHLDAKGEWKARYNEAMYKKYSKEQREELRKVTNADEYQAVRRKYGELLCKYAMADCYEM
jgi:hypothetical protein